MRGNILNKKVILGAGITGLSAGMSTESLIYEASDIAGGICASYYMDLEGNKNYSRKTGGSYRFEIGGGHWIFGADAPILSFINNLSPVKSHERKSAVYFPDLDLYVPYPLQNHLFYLPQDIKKKAIEDILRSQNRTVSTLTDWLEVNFGKTLCNLFFFPFHELYTAGLYTKIAPQDKFKTPVDKDLILKGAEKNTPAIGYNVTFVYPQDGLDDLIRKMAEGCKINFNKRVAMIDLKKREVYFEDESGTKYEKAVSILPLNETIEMTGIRIGESDPYTSVLVVNIGAKKGSKCPDYHWIYIPKSKAGFHRVGFYSNVDGSFLPLSSRENNDRASIYVEKAYRGGEKPTDNEIKKIYGDIAGELQSWGFINEVEVIDPTWIEIAYTWERPNSVWKHKALSILQENEIYQTGRYGKWKFQGIAESIKDGLEVKKGIYG